MRRRYVKQYRHIKQERKRFLIQDEIRKNQREFPFQQFFKWRNPWRGLPVPKTGKPLLSYSGSKKHDYVFDKKLAWWGCHEHKKREALLKLNEATSASVEDMFSSENENETPCIA